MAAYISFQPKDYVNTVLYTGNGTAIGSGGNTITGYDFTPSWTWMKQRDTFQSWGVYGSVMGVEETLRFNGTDALVSKPEGVTAFNSSGWVCGSEGRINSDTQPYINWGFRAGTTTGITTDGSTTITPTSYSFNQTSGFSQIKYTGNSTNDGQKVPHGLGAAPEVIIVKSLASSSQWSCYFKSLGNTKAIVLNTPAAPETDAGTGSYNYWYRTDPDSVNFTIGSSHYTNPSEALIAYCFKEKPGYSKIGYYKGNGNADGTFVYTGFRPRFIMQKITSTTGDWTINSTIVETYNGGNGKNVIPNAANVENDYPSTNLVDFLSNGFKHRVAANQNNSGADYIYMAFSEFPTVSSNDVPGVAR